MLALPLPDSFCLHIPYNILQINYFKYVWITQETSMSKIVKIFHRQTDRPTDKPTPRSSSRSLKIKHALHFQKQKIFWSYLVSTRRNSYSYSYSNSQFWSLKLTDFHSHKILVSFRNVKFFTLANFHCPYLQSIDKPW